MRRLAILLSLLGCLVGCGGDSTDSSSTPSAMTVSLSGSPSAQIWQGQCAACHGRGPARPARGGRMASRGGHAQGTDGARRRRGDGDPARGPGPGGPNPTVHSLGYCDDTTILASSVEELEEMNSVVHRFCRTHNLSINQIKTKVTGRSAGGVPFSGRIHWPGSSTPFKTAPPGDSIRHLGAWISLDLDWGPLDT